VIDDEHGSEVLGWDEFGAAARDLVDLHDAHMLIVDDVADTGNTLALVVETVRPQVAELRTAVLYDKPRSIVRCDYVWRSTDRWIDFPWSSKATVGGNSADGLAATTIGHAS
jgi:hypothetical protein